MHIHEPLAESAALAYRLAGELCASGGRDCGWYHGTWQYLRLFNIITSISSDDDFLLQSFRELAARKSCYQRVLISGTADYAMLARLLAAYGDTGNSLQVTVLDLCPTPLELNRWYAERCGLEIRTYQGDILDFNPGSSFDLVCAHSFLGFFTAEQRNRVVGKWQELLRDGGKIITSQRVRPDHAGPQVRFRAEEIARLRDRALEMAATATDLHGVTGEMLAGWTERYASNKGGYPVCSERELAAPFITNGLRLDYMQAADETSRRNDRPAGPWSRCSSRYRIIASRSG